MRPLTILLIPLALAACSPDETLTAFVPSDSVWTLTEMNGALVAFRTILTFPEPGRIAGQAPCNRYSATQSAPYPWFDTDEIVATKLACDALADEQAFFATLEAIAFAEVSGPSLVLSGEAGEMLVFSQQ